MSLVIAAERPNVLARWLITFILALLAAGVHPAYAARVVSESTPAEAEQRAVDSGDSADRVVVDPGPDWSRGEHDWNRWPSDRWHGGPRVSISVDRGDWGTYGIGEPLWVYFRVDRPCYVTIVDHAPDGRVEILYPNRWSGSNFVTPERTYRIPERRSYSLRTAGPEGIETLVACAHELPWPSGPSGVWVPPSPGMYDRHHRRAGPGRVIVGSRRAPWGIAIGWPDHWAIHPDWRGLDDRWTCDSVSFHVAGDRWYGGQWEDRPGSYDGGRYYDERYYGQGDRGWPPRPYARSFTMRNKNDALFLDLEDWGERGVLRIECTESRGGDPTEVTGVVHWEHEGAREPLLRLDVEGRHGDRPRRGETFKRAVGSLLVEVEVLDFRIEQKKTWQRPRLEWIEFDVRIYPR